MANVKQCDRCKTFYIKDFRPYPYMEVRDRVTDARSRGYDLCDDCQRALERFMHNEEVEGDLDGPKVVPLGNVMWYLNELIKEVEGDGEQDS